MGMPAILFNHAERFEQIGNMPSTEGTTDVKSGDNWSSCFREDVQRKQDFIHVYSPGARADNPGGQNFDCD